jgi:hypothetical protein
MNLLCRDMWGIFFGVWILHFIVLSSEIVNRIVIKFTTYTNWVEWEFLISQDLSAINLSINITKKAFKARFYWLVEKIQKATSNINIEFIHLLKKVLGIHFHFNALKIRVKNGANEEKILLLFLFERREYFPLELNFSFLQGIIRTVVPRKNLMIIVKSFNLLLTTLLCANMMWMLRARLMDYSKIFISKWKTCLKPRA